MSISAGTITRLEKAAVDNGFDLQRECDGDWLAFDSSQTSLRVWLTAFGESLFLVAFSREDVCAALAGLGVVFTNPLPDGALEARSVSEIPALHHLVRRAFQLSLALPDAPLQVFQTKTTTLPRSTEAEKLVVQRVGQNIFRKSLLEYWEGRCAMIGLGVPALLRASHIKPWADCEKDAERLDVFNGFLLAPHLDAAFDQGFITVQDDGEVTIADTLSREDRTLLGLNEHLNVVGIADGHRAYLPWHRMHIFRGMP